VQHFMDATIATGVQVGERFHARGRKKEVCSQLESPRFLQKICHAGLGWQLQGCAAGHRALVVVERHGNFHCVLLVGVRVCI